MIFVRVGGQDDKAGRGATAVLRVLGLGRAELFGQTTAIRLSMADLNCWRTDFNVHNTHKGDQQLNGTDGGKQPSCSCS
jgi:hypothetical protein